MTIICSVKEELDVLLYEIRFKYSGLPYLFASSKLHKKKYRWITRAAKCTFSGVANMITQTLKLILVELRIWCGVQALSMFNLHQKKTFCWVIESLYEFIINLLEHMHVIYIADITQCYEKIPLMGLDNLHEALEFILQKGFCSIIVRPINIRFGCSLIQKLGWLTMQNGINNYMDLPIGSR